MDQRTRDALEKSIEHWRENADCAMLGYATISADDCALCALFYAARCMGCPVSARTGGIRCDGSPYRAAADAMHDWGVYGLHENEAAFRAAAREELAFLESLRDKDGEEK